MQQVFLQCTAVHIDATPMSVFNTLDMQQSREADGLWAVHDDTGVYLGYAELVSVPNLDKPRSIALAIVPMRMVRTP